MVGVHVDDVVIAIFDPVLESRDIARGAKGKANAGALGGFGKQGNPGGRQSAGRLLRYDANAQFGRAIGPGGLGEKCQAADQGDKNAFNG